MLLSLISRRNVGSMMPIIHHTSWPSKSDRYSGCDFFLWCLQLMPPCAEMAKGNVNNIAAIITTPLNMSIDTMDTMPARAVKAITTTQVINAPVCKSIAPFERIEMETATTFKLIAGNHEIRHDYSNWNPIFLLCDYSAAPINRLMWFWKSYEHARQWNK